jgi:hypothetical protein
MAIIAQLMKEMAFDALVSPGTRDPIPLLPSPSSLRADVFHDSRFQTRMARNQVSWTPRLIRLRRSETLPNLVGRRYAADKWMLTRCPSIPVSCA